jgi:serine/threonine protein phosphatase PrpC
MRSWQVLDANHAAPEPTTLEGAEVHVYSRRSPLREGRNQDAAGLWALDDGSVVLAVADGMGGAPSGADAATMAIAELDRHLDDAGRGDDLRPFILDAFERANRAILDLGVGAGTTLVVAQVADDGVRLYHVGDSAAMLVGQRGRVKIETIPHSPVGYAVASGMLDPVSALDHDDRHYLSNHLGTEDMRIEMGSARPVAARDTLLLASDGLFDNLTPDEIIRTIRSGPLGDAAAGLARTCADRMPSVDVPGPGKADDVTFLLYRRRSAR